MAWDHVTLVNIIYTIGAVATAFTSGMSWLQARRNNKVATNSNEKLTVAAEKQDIISANVNGNLTALQSQLIMAQSEIKRLTGLLAAYTGKADH